MQYAQHHFSEAEIMRISSNQKGFTITELLISMVVFVFAIAAASAVFAPLLNQFKQQSKIAETQIAGITGLEMLRRDIEHAGLGLPWNIPAGIAYPEASASTTAPIPAPDAYNDAPPDAPRAILSGNDAVNYPGIGASDYLVIKATNIATNDTATKWAHVTIDAGWVKTVKSWGPQSEDLKVNEDRVIVLIPSRSTTNQRILVDNGGTFFTIFKDGSNFPDAFAPDTENDSYLIYGVDPDTALRMPYNRADYYIRRVNGTTIPSRCAPGTGVLMKSVIAHADGGRGPGLALMDCVADFQIVFGLDANDDGNVTYNNDLTAPTPLTAQEIRNQVKEVRVYILTHEGQKDTSYTYPNAIINIPAAPDPAAGAGRTFNFATSGITDWQMYRWKVYSLVVKPKNLR
jgi:prepilin-type N-terminal cleavage/methylation domain-containing protein